MDTKTKLLHLGAAVHSRQVMDCAWVVIGSFVVVALLCVPVESHPPDTHVHYLVIEQASDGSWHMIATEIASQCPLILFEYVPKTELCLFGTS